jgi:putative tricarboxylic transport membrane protein
VLSRVSQAGKGELAFAGSLLLVSIVVYWDTHRLVIPDNNVAVSPRTFPYIVATVLLLASFGVILQVLRGKAATPEGADSNESFQRADFRTMGIIIGSICLHVFLLELTGYIISAAISFWGVAYAFGAKRMLRLGLISLIFATLVYFSFSTFLDVQLPKWILEEFISGLGSSNG